MNLILIQGRSQIGGEEDKGKFEEGEMVQAEMETWKSLGHICTLCMHCTQKLLSTIWKIVKKTFQSGQKAIQLEGNTGCKGL